MAETQTAQQDPKPRSAHAAMRITQDEKRAIQLVAAYRNVSESDLLRGTLLEEIVAEHARLFPAQAEAQSA